jgi:hypothetical protein
LLIDTNKIPYDVCGCFDYVEKISKKMNKDDIVIISQYAIKSNIASLKYCFALNGFNGKIINNEDFVSEFVLYEKK